MVIGVIGRCLVNVQPPVGWATNSCIVTVTTHPRVSLVTTAWETTQRRWSVRLPIAQVNIMVDFIYV